MDSENQKYCDQHGEALQSNLFCSKCLDKKGKPVEKTWYDYRDQEIDKQNEKPWTEKKTYYGNYEFSVSVCHNCKYFMYHTFQYCYKCPNKMHQMRLGYQDMKEQLKDYKQGY